MRGFKGYTVMDDNTSNPIVTDSKQILPKAGFSESEISYFAESIVMLLDDYAASIGKGARVRYRIWRNLVNVEIWIQIPGVPFDPFTEGLNAQKRSYDEMFSRNPGSGGPRLSYKYRLRTNSILISVPLAEKSKKLIKGPIVWGVILGLTFGFLLRLLPREVSGFITNELASPLQNITLKLIAGVMGPVIFFSLLSSTIALSGINSLTGFGFRLIRRFLLIILFLIAVSVLVSGLIFMNFGAGGSEFTISHLFSMRFDTIPTNLIDPFLKNHTAQLVILGLLTGAGLLIAQRQRRRAEANHWTDQQVDHERHADRAARDARAPVFQHHDYPGRGEGEGAAVQLEIYPRLLHCLYRLYRDQGGEDIDAFRHSGWRALANDQARRQGILYHRLHHFRAQKRL